MKHEGGSIMLWGCFAAGGTGALYKIDVEATSQDNGQKVKAWLQNGSSKWTMTPSILPMCGKMA